MLKASEEVSFLYNFNSTFLNTVVIVPCTFYKQNTFISLIIEKKDRKLVVKIIKILQTSVFNKYTLLFYIITSKFKEINFFLAYI